MSIDLSAIFVPSTKTSPPLMSSKRFKQRKNVDLPDPDGPMIKPPIWLMVKHPLRTSFY